MHDAIDISIRYEAKRREVFSNEWKHFFNIERLKYLVWLFVILAVCAWIMKW